MASRQVSVVAGQKGVWGRREPVWHMEGERPRVWNLGCEWGEGAREGEAWTWSPDKVEQ